MIREWLDRRRLPRRVEIVVSGMPKSGTTAAAMLLGAAAGLEVNSDPFHKLDERGIEFRDHLFSGELGLGTLVADRPGFFSGGLIKDPNFIFFADQLREILPHSAFVIVIRDPRDNIRSLLNRLGLPGRVPEARTAFQGINPTWMRVLEGRTPEVGGSDYVECLARRWVQVIREYLAREDWMTPFRYEEFKAGKIEVIHSTLERLGMQADYPIHHLVDRQFQPKGDQRVTWEEFFGPAELASIHETCGPEMERLGYHLLPHSP